MKKQKKILIFAEGISMAHPSRMSQLCRQIQDDNTELHIATPKNYFWLFKDLKNINCHNHETISNQLFNERLYETKFPLTLQELSSFKDKDSILINTIKPDLIINDFRLSSFAAAKQHQVPLINLIQYHWHPNFKKENLLPYVRPVKILGKRISSLISPVVAPFILKTQLGLINQFLETNKLSPCKNIYDFYCAGDFRIFPDVASIFNSPALEKNELFIGPLIWRNKETPWPTNWPKLRTNQKSIYLTMGSTGNHNLVPKLAKVLSSENFRLFISTSGNKYPSLPSSNTYTADFVPAESVLEISDLIICNGGTSTTYHGIANGTPVFAFPTNMDQYLHSHQLKIKGVADYESFNELDIVRFIEKVFYLVSTHETKSHVLAVKNEIAKYQAENPVLSFVNSI